MRRETGATAVNSIAVAPFSFDARITNDFDIWTLFGQQPQIQRWSRQFH
jgi:hypothetical protein